MKIDFNIEFQEQDDMTKVNLEIFDATHVEESNGNKLHTFKFTCLDKRSVNNNFEFTVDDTILGKLFSVIALRLERND